MRARSALLLLALLLACACGAAGSGRRDSLVLPLRRRRLQGSSLSAASRSGTRSLLAQATAQLPLDANDWGQGCVTSRPSLRARGVRAGAQRAFSL
jgi:hypothetical protein